MADLADSAVTLLDDWYEGGLNGRKFRCRKVSLVLTGQGTNANAIPASVLKLDEIHDVTPFVKSDDGAIVPASPNAAGDTLLLRASATEAPADHTGTFTGVVRGK